MNENPEITKPIIKGPYGSFVVDIESFVEDVPEYLPEDLIQYMCSAEYMTKMHPEIFPQNTSDIDYTENIDPEKLPQNVCDANCATNEDIKRYLQSVAVVQITPDCMENADN